MALVCRYSFFSEVLAQANAHTIDRCSPNWWDAWAVRMKIKVGKCDRCDPAMGNGTRQWHLYVAAHPSAGYTCKQIRTQSTNAALTKRALQPHKWAMEQGNSTCVSPLALQQATRTNKRRHGSPLPTRHAFPSSTKGCTQSTNAALLGGTRKLST